mmetsp:Transcript_2858/g.8657  ORF Transcript_2858/g.8657 Transcript_2858/m.8657 type:complete len:229 (+) Transcript_2858:451-1137(+)
MLKRRCNGASCPGWSRGATPVLKLRNSRKLWQTFRRKPCAQIGSQRSSSGGCPARRLQCSMSFLLALRCWNLHEPGRRGSQPALAAAETLTISAQSYERLQAEVQTSNAKGCLQVCAAFLMCNFRAFTFASEHIHPTAHAVHKRLERDSSQQFHSRPLRRKGAVISTKLDAARWDYVRKSSLQLCVPTAACWPQRGKTPLQPRAHEPGETWPERKVWKKVKLAFTHSL